MDWIDDFLSLYSSKEKGDFAKALDLKRVQIPSKLYRYRTTKNLEYLKEEICEGKIFLSLPSEMNDPLDSHSLLAEQDLATYLERKEVFMSVFEKLMDKDAFDKVFNDSNWLEELLIFVAQQSSLDDVDKFRDAITYAWMKMAERFNITLNNTINKSYRFACFTEKSTNLPMWNHYANEHTWYLLRI